jgi:two-component system phosphate regulon response regulator PhoB
VSTPPTDEDAGATPALTPTEARLLATLRSEPGRVFTRLELIHIVMPDALVLERTIDVHIKALRKKLGDAVRIQTVRNVGYCLILPPEVQD